MNDGFAVRGAVCSASPPRQSMVSRAALAVGIVLALSLTLLFGFTPKAWADFGEPSPGLVYSSSQRTTISWTLDVYKSSDNGGMCTVDQTRDGINNSWRYEQVRTGRMEFQSGYVNANGNAVPSLCYWPTYYKPFSLYVDGVRVAWSDKGGEIDSIVVQWDGVMDVRENSGEAGSPPVYGNLDLRIFGHGKGPVSTQDYYRPMGNSTWLGDSWNLHPGTLEQGTTGVYDGGTHNIELVLYDRTETPTLPDIVIPDQMRMEPPAIALKFEDGTEYEEGTWTNKNVAVEATPVAGEYRDKFHIILFRDNGCIEVARSGWSTLPFVDNLKARYVVSKSTPMEGEMYFGGLFDESNWPSSPKSLSRYVKVDKENPVISGISMSGSTPVVSASDALSGVASIEGRKSASDEWVPINEISLSSETTSLYVKVTDNAGNSETRMLAIPSNPDPVDPPTPPDPGTPPDSGDDTPGRGDGFKTQRAA